MKVDGTVRIELLGVRLFLCDLDQIAGIADELLFLQFHHRFVQTMWILPIINAVLKKEDVPRFEVPLKQSQRRRLSDCHPLPNGPRGNVIERAPSKEAHSQQQRAQKHRALHHQDHVILKAVAFEEDQVAINQHHHQQEEQRQHHHAARQLTFARHIVFSSLCRQRLHLAQCADGGVALQHADTLVTQQSVPSKWFVGEVQMECGYNVGDRGRYRNLYRLAMLPWREKRLIVLRDPLVGGAALRVPR